MSVDEEIAKIFQCTRCGFCCHGETTVSLDSDDQERMCSALGLSREQTAQKYWRISGAQQTIVQMKVVAGHCIFFNEGCTVHQGRPWRCAQWPLHDSILDDENNFMIIAESCPGINKEIGYQKFCEILRGILAEQHRVKC